MQMSSSSPSLALAKKKKGCLEDRQARGIFSRGRVTSHQPEPEVINAAGPGGSGRHNWWLIHLYQQVEERLHLHGREGGGACVEGWSGERERVDVWRGGVGREGNGRVGGENGDGREVDWRE